MLKSSMSIHTDFAPAERSSDKKILEQNTMFGKAEVLSKLLNVTSTMVAILNKERQIVYANKLFFQKLGAANLNTLIGKRPGEAVFCIHAIEAPGGCGTTKFCTVCGAVNAILEAQEGAVSMKECRITTQNSGALDLKVTATPYEWENEPYTIFAIEDISNEKRKQALEQVFFHDILNAAGGISGLTSVLEITEDPQEMAEMAKIINRGTNHLIEEIKSQRLLTAAENGALVLNCKKIASLEILQDVASIYANHEVCTNKFIHIQSDAEEVEFKSDHILVRRILGNMLKNALEATMPGDTVTLDCKRKDEKIAFSVHNKVVIPSEIQLQLFNRSFSTKGLGRGIGTYSMKLFGEKYLKGEVDFLSTPKKGTTFFLRLPAENPDCGAVK
jgi:K+-sensing histidine kinase KdpD